MATVSTTWFYLDTRSLDRSLSAPWTHPALSSSSPLPWQWAPAAAR